MKNPSTKTLFILNLSSGRKKGSALLKELKKRKLNFHISKSAESFKEFIAEEGRQYKNLVICGGDGTIHSIINQTHHLDVAYAIYPGGSGNGLARELGYKKNLDRLIDGLKRNEKLAVDLIKINNQYCVNMSGIGFDGYVAHQFDKGNKRGFQSYIKETLKALRSYKLIEAELNFDGKKIAGQFFMINIANTRQFGNNAYIAPNAQFNDGLIEVAMIKKVPLFSLPTFLYRMFSLGLKNSKYIQFLQAKELYLKTNANFYHIDGEPLAYEEPLQISIPKQIQFIKPI